MKRTCLGAGRVLTKSQFKNVTSKGHVDLYTELVPTAYIAGNTKWKFDTCCALNSLTPAFHYEPLNCVSLKGLLLSFVHPSAVLFFN